MQDDRIPHSHNGGSGRLLWIIGLAVGIATGGIVAFGLLSVAPPMIGAQEQQQPG